MAADIESLIRQALARQNGFDPQVRAGIYQSSRNALAKMIAKSGLVPPEVIESRNAALELTIARIEQDFTSEVVPQRGPEDTDSSIDGSSVQSVQPEPQAPQSPSLSIPPSFEPGPNNNAQSSSTSVPPQAQSPTIDPGVQHVPQPAAHMPGPVTNDNADFPAMDDTQIRYAEPTPQYARPRRQPIRYAIWITAIAIFAVVGWVAYMITMEFIVSGNPPRTPGQLSSSDNASNGTFVTILDPSQPGALVTAGNGTADILSDTSQPAIRIMSLRKPDSRETSAEPMLLELAPGILKDIAGKKVTVEIQAKSGDTGPATFSVSCEFGNLGECGRKRFRIGLQPEAVIFSIQISADYKEGQRAALAINTDVTSAAALSGKGAKIDIIYARIRTGNGS